MDYSLSNAGGNQTNLKVSIWARLIPALFYIIPAFGGALSSILLMNVLRILRQAETAGVGALMGAMTEATLPVLGSLYLGVFGGIVVILVLVVRMIMQTKTASPAGWFFILCGLFLLVPAGLFAEAESQIIEVLIDPRNSPGLMSIASNLNLLLISSIVTAPIIFIILIVLAVLPLSSRAKPKWGSLLIATAIEILLIAVTVAFQLRVLWFYESQMPK